MQHRRVCRALAVAAVAFAATGCGERGHAAAPGAGGSVGVSEFPSFPAGEDPPPIGQIASMLASGLPEADRAAARRLLVDDILSRDLRDLPSNPSAKPSARAIVRAAYRTLVDRLGALPREHRLAYLVTIACTRRGDRVTRRATALAVARYVADRGRPDTILVVGYLGEAEPYLAMSPDELRAEADRTERDLAGHERDAGADRACFEHQRPALVHGRRALEAARSGVFDPASGPFYVFLRNADANPRRADPE